MNTGEIALTIQQVVTLNADNLDCSMLYLARARDDPSPFQLSTQCTGRQITGTRLSFFMHSSDLIAVKLARNLATGFGDTHLVIDAGSGIIDSTSGLNLMPVLLSNPDPVDDYIADSISPNVAAGGFYQFDLDEGTMTVLFDEPIDRDSIDPTSGGLVLQHSYNTTYEADVFVVQSASCPPPCEDGLNVTIQLSPSDLNRLKQRRRVCMSAADCWLTLHSPGNAFVSDTARNPISPLLNGDRSERRLLVTFIDDTSSPLLQRFTLNLTSNQLLLTFDEPVDVSTFNVSGIILQSSSGVNDPTLSYQLTDSVITSDDDTVVVVSISQADLIGLQSRTSVATSIANTFITLLAGAVRDLSYRSNPSAVVMQQATEFVPDTAPPVVEGFDLNFDDNTVVLSFSEPVLLNNVDPTRLTFHSQFNGSGIVYTLTGGVVAQSALAGASIVTVLLSQDDVTALKITPGLADDANTTSLSVESGLALDTNSVTSSAILPFAALQVRSYIPDSTPVRVTGFTLDMNNGRMNVFFNDVVDATTFRVQAITLQGALFRSATDFSILSTSTHSLDPGFTVSVYLSFDDLNRINQIRNLATSRANSYLTAAATIVDDVYSVDAVAVTDGKALQASAFTPDLTRPTLDRFSLDLNAGRLWLTFSETVDILTLQTSEITLQTSPGSADTYTLGAPSMVLPSDADYMFAIMLSDSDLNAIKLHVGLGTLVANTYLSLTENTVTDMTGNLVIPISNAAAQQADFVTPDTSPAVLREFSLDVNVGELILTFDETVNAGSFDVTQVALVNGREGGLSVQYTLTTSIASSVNSNIITVTLSRADLDAVKGLSGLATSIDDSYVTVSSSVVQDMSGNGVNPVTAQQPQQASGFISDRTRPALVQVDLDMDAGELLLFFSETVDADSFDPTQLTMQNAFTGVARTLTLSGGTWLRQDTPTITYRFSANDLNELKLHLDIATSNANSFISFTQDLVRDTAGNNVVAVSSSAAARVTNFAQDLTNPRLSGFVLDLEQRTISLTFDETVDASTLGILDIGLQDRPSDRTQSLTLSAGSSTSSPDGPVVLVDLSDTDINNIARLYPLGSDAASTFITLQSGAVQDTNGNPCVAITSDAALQASDHTADVTRPALNSYDLDFNTGILTLSFSETVNISSFVPGEWVLQNTGSSPTSFYAFTGGDVLQPENTVLELRLSSTDLNTINALPSLATLAGNTFLSYSEEAVKDMNRNPILPRAMSAAQPVGLYTGDTTAPNLEQFDLDYDSGLVTLMFDETVDLSLLVLSELTFAISSGSTITFSLTNSTLLDSGYQTGLRLQLSDFELNELKRLRICVTFDSCYVSFTSVLVSDAFSNSITPIALSSPMGVSGFVPDTTPPRVMSFDLLDLDSGIVTLVFSETIVSMRVWLRISMFHETFENATHEFKPFPADVITGDGPILTLQLSDEALDTLKLNTDLCTRASNCWLRLNYTFVKDVSDNFVTPILVGSIGQEQTPMNVIPDTSSPILTGFAVDMNQGMMVFTFDEPVNELSFDPLSLVFQDGLVSSGVSFTPRYHGNFSRSADGLEIRWNMTQDDLNLLKATEFLFEIPENTYLTHSVDIVTDVSGNKAANRTDGVSALKVSTLIGDTVSPRLVSLSAFNLDNGSFTLLFDEPVNISAIMYDQIVFIHNYTIDTSPPKNLTLDATSFVLYENGTISNGTAYFDIGAYSTNCTVEELLSDARNAIILERLRIWNMTTNATVPDGNTLAQISNVSDAELYPVSLAPCNLTLLGTKEEEGIRLTGGSVEYTNGRKMHIVVYFNRHDLRLVKLDERIGQRRSSTYIHFNSSAIQDFYENGVMEVSPLSAKNLQNRGYMADVTPASLEGFGLDLNTGMLSLYFNDVMDTQSVQPLAVTLISEPGSNNTYTLMGLYPAPLSSVPDDYVINITLQVYDLNEVKANLELATGVNNSFVSVTGDVARDIYNRTSFPLAEEDALQVVYFTADETGPEILSFALDLNAGTLNITFNEPVFADTFMSSQVTLQNAANLTTTSLPMSYTLSQGLSATDTADPRTITTMLNFTDLNALKSMVNLTTELADAFALIDDAAIEDVSGNLAMATSRDMAVMATEVLPDTEPPFLVSFDLNLNDNILVLRFSEAVMPDTLLISGIMLINTLDFASMTLETVTLRPTSLVTTEPLSFDAVVLVHLTPADQEAIKDIRLPLAKSIDDTFIVLEEGSVRDYAGFLSLETQGLQAANLFEDLTCTGMRAASYVNDTTPPVLESFTVDLVMGQLLLSFSETVNISTFLFTSVIFQDTFGTPTNAYPLRYEGEVLSDINDPELLIQLNENDLNAIKANRQLFSQQANSYIALQNMTIFDMSDNPIILADAIRTASFGRDSVSPLLTAFALDLDSGEISLTFDEPVSVLTFDPTAITLHNSDIDPTRNYTLEGTGSAVSLTGDLVIVFSLSENDQNNLKAFEDFAVDVNTTFLTHSDLLVNDTDITANRVTPRNLSNALQAHLVVEDRVTFSLISFSLMDLNTDTIRLSFFEPVNVSTLNTTGISLLNAVGGSQVVVLSGGEAQYVESSLRREIEIQLTRDDLLLLKGNSMIATSFANTFVRITEGTILDMNGNSVDQSSDLPVARYISDITGPQPESFHLDMNVGVLEITFNDVIRVSSFDPQYITFQSMMNVEASNDQLMQDLQSLRDVTGADEYAYTIVQYLDRTDLNALKAKTSVATMLNNTFLSSAAELVSDWNLRPSIAITVDNALLAANFTPDSTPPVLESFRLDMNTGILTLSFNETVNPGSLNTSLVSLVGNGGVSFRLTGGTFFALPLTDIFTVTLTTDDVNALKALPDVAVDESTTMLSLDAFAIADTNDNYIVGLAPFKPSTDVLTPDTTSPALSSFNLDMNTGVVTLFFSETVNASSLSPSEIIFQGHSAPPSLTFRLTGGTWNRSVDRTYIQITLTADDLNELKRLVGLADSVDDTFIYFSSSLVHDMLSEGLTRPIDAVIATAARIVTQFTSDSTAPRITDFSLDLTAEILSLTFDETVNASSLMISEITLQAFPSPRLVEQLLPIFIDANETDVDNGTNGSSIIEYMTVLVEEYPPPVAVRLTVGGVNNSISTSSDGTVIDIELGVVDLNNLKRYTSLAISRNTTYLSFPNVTLMDMNGNLVEPVSPENALIATSFTADFIPPILLRFDLDLTGELLLLTFSEVVNASSLDVREFSFLSADVSNPAAIYTLTMGAEGSLLTGMDNDNTITISLGLNDLNEIKKLVTLATMRSNTFANFTSSFVSDMNGNQILPQVGGINSSQVTIFTDDAIRPSLTSFDLDVNQGALVLYFSETVRSSSVNVTEIALTSAAAPNGTVFYFNTSTVMLLDGPVIYIDISRDDLNAIKYLIDLAQDENSTNIIITAASVSDMSDNFVVPINATVPLPVDLYVRDTTSPRLLAFDLDMDDGVLTLHFDETVNASSLNLLELSFISANISLGGSVHNYSLTGGEILSDNSVHLVIQLDQHDVDTIKLNTELAVSMETTYLLVDDGVVTDLSLDENPSNMIFLNVQMYTVDETGPILESFMADLNMGTITLNFNEPVDSATLDVSGLTLLSAPNSTSSLTLSGGNTSSDDGHQLVVLLSVDDLNELKKMEDTFVSQETSWLAAAVRTIRDMAGNPLQPVTISSPLNAVSFINDTTMPVLVAFHVDMSAEIVTLEFAETVNTSSILFTGITFQSAFNSSNQYTLTGGRLLDVTDATTVRFEFDHDDLNTIKAQRIALSRATTWMSIDSTVILDQFGVAVRPRVNGVTSLMVTNYTIDTVDPVLLSFNLSLDRDELYLSFSETVNVEQTLNASVITILGGPNFELVGISHTLNLDQMTLSDDVYTDVVTIRVGRQDINAIKSNLDLATSVANTYIAFMTTLIADMNGNQVQPRRTSNPLNASFVFEDETQPRLEAFDLDMNLGILTLSFSEPVDPTSLDISQFALQNYRLTESNQRHIFSGGLTEDVASPVLTVTLTDPDLNEVKRLNMLATGRDDTWIRATSAGVRDVSMNFLYPIPNGNALQVSQYVNDTTRPRLLSFELDLTREQLTLTFDETVNQATLNTSGLTIQSEIATVPVEERRLTGGWSIEPDSTIVVVQLGVEDLNYIKSVRGLAVAMDSTFLSLEDFTIDDMAGNDVIPILSTMAEGVSVFTPDTKSPILEAFDLDLTNEILTLVFNETVDVGSLNVTYLELRSSLYISNDTTRYSLRSSMSVSVDGPVVMIDLDVEDLNEIKRLFLLAVSRNTTYLYIFPEAINDTNYNMVEERGLAVRDYTEDMVSPQAMFFSFDLNLGELSMTFDETVNVDTFDPNELTLQSTSDNDPLVTSSVTLVNATVLTTYNGTTVRVRLTDYDLNAVKALTALATGTANTFLSLTNNTVLDMNANDLMPVSPSTALQVTMFTNDTTDPELVAYTLDVNTGVLYMTFSETVRAPTLMFAEFSLQGNNLSLSPADRFMFNDSTGSLNFSTVVTVTFSVDDLNRFKANRLVGTELADTLLTMNSTAIVDMFDNEVSPIVNGQAQRVAQYIPDITPPFLVRYDFDANQGLVTFEYSETVDTRNYDPAQLTFQSSAVMNDSLHVYRLTAGRLLDEDTVTVRLVLTDEDFNEVKRLIYLATSENDTFLSFTSNHLRDMSGNSITPIPGSEAQKVSVYTPDDTRPRLNNFTLDLNADTLTLTFDETVNTSSLSVQEITLYESAGVEARGYSLESAYVLAEELAGKVVVEVLLSNVDLNELKRREFLAVSDNTTHIAFNELLVRDMNGNMNEPEEALQAELFVPDMVPPRLSQFELDLTTEILTLSFSETVDASTIDVTGITLLSDPPTRNNDSVGENATIYSRELIGGMVLLPDEGGSPLGPDDPVILLKLDSRDLNYIKSVIGLATETNNTWLSLQSFTIADMNRNPVEEVISANPLQAANFTEDVVRPELVSFNLDIDLGRLDITFSETVDVSSLNVSGITLQTGPLSVMEDRLTLSPGAGPTHSYSNSSDWPFISIEIGSIDLNELKRRTQLAVSNDTTFITLTSFAIMDTNGNMLVPVSSGNATPVDNFVPDTTPPELLEFRLNMDEGSVTFTFSETVDCSSLDPTSLTILSYPGAQGQEQVPLTGGTVTNAQNSTSVRLLIDIDDLNELKRIREIATSTNNSYVTIAAGGILDMNENLVVAIDSDRALNASSFVADMTPPQLDVFHLDLNLGLLTLVFDETVEADSLMVMGITLQDNQTASDPANTHTLANSEGSIADSTIINISLSFEDLNDIKRIRGLASLPDRSNTFITLENFTIVDMNGNSLVAVLDGDAEMVTNFIVDTTPPRLVDYDFDLDSGLLTLTFTETVDTTSFRVAEVSLQSMSMGGPAMLYLQRTCSLEMTTLLFSAWE